MTGEKPVSSPTAIQRSGRQNWSSCFLHGNCGALVAALLPSLCGFHLWAEQLLQLLLFPSQEEKARKERKCYSSRGQNSKCHFLLI